MSEKVENMYDFMAKLSAKCTEFDAQMRKAEATLEVITFLIESNAGIHVKPIYCKGYLIKFEVLEDGDGMYEGQIVQYTQLLRQIANKYGLQDWAREEESDE